MRCRTASLRCGVPVSLRAPGDTSMSNQVTMLVASLATDVADPVERMLAIKASMQVGKGVVADTGALQPDDLHVPGLPAMMSTASLWAERLRLADFMAPMVNVVISNVRGPARTMYLHGAAMCSHFPVSIPVALDRAEPHRADVCRSSGSRRDRVPGSGSGRRCVARRHRCGLARTESGSIAAASVA